MPFFLIFLLLFLLLGCASSPYPHLPLKEWNRNDNCCQKTGKTWAIASGGTYSSQAGKKILEVGGNGIDAAIATAFALAVERPHSLGIGGGGFGIFYFKGKNPQSFFVDFRETAPRKAHRDLYLDSKGEVIPGLSRYGSLAVATPGFVPGLFAIHKRWGKLPWPTLLKPAIELARKGFPIYPSLEKAIQKEKERLFEQKYNIGLFMPHGKVLQEGELLIQKDLSQTLERISKDPGNEIRTGATARKLVSFLKKQGGILEIEDLKSYQPRFQKPMILSWKERKIFMAGPPSAGGILFSQMLGMLSEDPLSVLSESYYLHLITEVLKRAYADRSSLIGDLPPAEQVFSKALETKRIAHLRKSIDFSRATPAVEIQPAPESKWAESPLKDKHTTHLSIVDPEGNAIALTLTINDHFGARLAVPETGIFLNNEMDDFSIKPGVKNLFGLTGGAANEVAPRKRPASSMSPTIVTDSEGPLLVIGGAGGSRITSQVFQVMLNTLDRPQGSLKNALFHPRIHHQWKPDVLEIELGFNPGTLSSLKERGHNLKEPQYKAIIQGVYRNPQHLWEAVFDPRDEGGVEAK